MIAAFDYKRLRETAKRSSLLFIAHRKEILEQSILTFQAILNDYAINAHLFQWESQSQHPVAFVWCPHEAISADLLPKTKKSIAL